MMGIYLGKECVSVVGGRASSTNITLQRKTVTPSAKKKTVTADSGYTGLSAVTVEGDENLTSENIMSGVSIFGVEGTGATSTDKTLTIEGAPADAKVVGDELNKKLTTTSANYVRSVAVSNNTIILTLGDGTNQKYQLAEDYTLPIATSNTLGGVMSGGDVEVDVSGILSVTHSSKSDNSTTAENANSVCGYTISITDTDPGIDADLPDGCILFVYE